MLVEYLSPETAFGKRDFMASACWIPGHVHLAQFMHRSMMILTATKNTGISVRVRKT